MTEFVMPTLGADMTEGTLVMWKKQVGDRVEKGDIIAEVETDKAAIEIEAFSCGTIERFLVQPGDKVPVGTPMAIIRDAQAPATTTAMPGTTPKETEPHVDSLATSSPPAAEVQPQSPSHAQGDRLRISPTAWRLAQELGVDPTSLIGTGPEGAISREDVQRAAAIRVQPELRQKGSAVPADSRQARIRHTIAAAMARSKREIPHYYLSTSIDMGPAMEWLRQCNNARGVAERLLPSVLLIKAVALALKEIPELNGFWKDGHAIRSEAIHVGVAISLRGGGLIAPAVHDADRLSLMDTMERLQDVVRRARAGSLRSSEMSDSTITVSSLGDLGADQVLGVIYPPQVALVGFGKIAERPWVVNGQVVARSVVTASLSADHRASDGHRGGLFLEAIDRLLHHPESL
ncbi:dihydrolipoamide acetyltransferase component of pyruvate dehydrogenase complex [Nitrospira sp.]|nr:dihydrolipoamide acetyltransferase component of pyruvate dehydrogenase complex [Nitrospira sp.]